MNPPIPELSVVILAYRSAESIESFVEKLISSLEGVEPNWEIVLVGNYIEGSDDQTPEVVKNMADKNSRIQAVVKMKKEMMMKQIQRESMQHFV